ncbi:MAG: paaC [Glaciihabitans sp.]|nr:paaC [Glaciihabitans sp.]MDQ1571829.1 ring,2-phenylacetyl-CoA epoxidase subunit PaaC [Actinomycetota bacterium]
MSVRTRRVSVAVTPESLAELVDDTSLAASDQVARYALGLGDDSLILAQRLGEWIANGPEIEEDIALGNIGLDTLGHARSFLTYAGSAWGRTEDDLAYFRTEPEFRCHQLFEQPIGDFAQTIARQLIASLYFGGLYRALATSQDSTLSAIATKAGREVEYHLDHSIQWLMRLSLGTDESRRRMVAGLTAMWPFVDELFRADPSVESLEAIAVEPGSLRSDFDASIARLLTEAELETPSVAFVRGGGRSGVHSEAFGPLLAEMQVLARAHPGAKW